MSTQQHKLVKDAFKHSLQRCTVHAYCLVNCAQYTFLRKSSWRGVSALFWFMMRWGGGEESEDTHLIGTLWTTEQQLGEFSEGRRSTSAAAPTWAGCMSTYDCICAWQDSVGGALTSMCRLYILLTASCWSRRGCSLGCSIMICVNRSPP